MSPFTAIEQSRQDGVFLSGWRFPRQANVSLKRLHGYWLSRCPPDMALPRRRDIDPADFPAPLQNILLLNVHDGEPWFTHRVAGAKLSWLLRRPMTGQPLGAGLPEVQRLSAVARAREVVLTQEPRYRSGDLGWCGRDYLNFEELLLPLAGPDGSTAMILGILMVLDPHGREC